MNFGRRSASQVVPNASIFPFAFGGGLDTETPSSKVKPGTAYDAINYEVGVEGGYVDTKGYERFSGLTAPSAGSYWVIGITLMGQVSVGDTVTGATSSATGKVLAIQDNDTLILTAVTGTWVSGENVTVSAVVRGVTTSAASERAADSESLDADYLALAADYYRGLISAVPGEGSILGGFYLSDVCYAVRNAVGGASAKLYKSSGTGWTEVALGRELAYTSGGAYEIQIGDTITGATSGATAVITAAIVRTGSWAGTDAVGTLVFASQTGTFQAENLNVGANLNVATIAGNSSAITLPAGGRYQFTTPYLFTDTSTARVFGANGVGRAFSFDGTTFIPITTSGTDTPSYVACFNQALVLAMPKGIIRYSPTGKPYTYDATLFAGDKRIGAECTGLIVETGVEGANALLIATRQRLYMMYGNDDSDYNVVSFQEQVGAVANTLAKVGSTLFLDDIGVVTYRATQQYGNFTHSSLTQHLRTWLNPKKRYAASALSVPSKNQYRLSFTDGHVLTMTFNGNKLQGAMPLYYPDPATVMWGAEDSNGDEVLFFGSTDGMVYQMERGTSFDGAAISAYVELHPLRMGRTEQQKSFHNCILESQGGGYAEYSIGYRLDYGSSDRLQPEADLMTEATFAGAIRWDDPVIFWDSRVYRWDEAARTPSSSVRLRGAGENIILTLAKSSAKFNPVTHSTASIRYSTRRLRT